jgi:hypothetical protein
VPGLIDFSSAFVNRNRCAAWIRNRRKSRKPLIHGPNKLLNFLLPWRCNSEKRMSELGATERHSPSERITSTGAKMKTAPRGGRVAAWTQFGRVPISIDLLPGDVKLNRQGAMVSPGCESLQAPIYRAKYARKVFLIWRAAVEKQKPESGPKLVHSALNRIT